jgi:lysophospholipase L1-like esterase
LQLVDWFTLVDDDPSLLSDDGLHPNDEGQRVLAQAVATSAARCAGA